MKLNSLRMVFAAALVGSVCSAQALTLTLTGAAVPNLVSANIVLSPVSPPFNPVGAGAFKGVLTDAPPYNSNPFYTYCVELAQSFSFNTSPLAGYSIVNGLSYFGGIAALPSSATTIVGRLGKLFTYLGGVNLPSSANQSAGIQLAVWESIYEGSNTLALGTGAFQATSTSTAIATANSLLASAAAVTTNLYSISVLKNVDAQDFLLIQRIPEPASLALAGLALAGLAYTRRRRA